MVLLNKCTCYRRFFVKLSVCIKRTFVTWDSYQPNKVAFATGDLTSNFIHISLIKYRVFFFTGDYTSKFTKLPGQTVLSSSSVIYQQVFDTNQCAKLCDNYQAFNCKSFDFCFDIGTCFLGKSHVFDVPKADVISNPMCNHYSRTSNYIFEI